MHEPTKAVRQASASKESAKRKLNKHVFTFAILNLPISSKITTQMRTLAKKELCQTSAIFLGNLDHYFDIKIHIKKKEISFV